jgi:flagellar protein FlaJ
MTYLDSNNAPLLMIISGAVVLLAASLLSLMGESSHQLFILMTFGSIAVTSVLSLKLLRKNHIKNQNELHNAKTNSSSHVGILTRYLVRSISADVLRSGRPEDTAFIVKKFQRYSLVSAAVVIPLILLVLVAAQTEFAQFEEARISIAENTVEIEDPELFTRGELEAISQPEAPKLVLAPIAPFLAVTLGVFPLLLLFYPKITYTSLRRSRKTIVEEELPFFSLYAAILQSVGTDLYSSFIITIGKNVFKAIENEALLLKRNVELFARSPLEALEELGRNHDSMAFKNFLLGYSSIARSGGDLSRYLETRAEEHFNLLKLKYSAYSRNVGYLVEALIVMLVIVPVLVVVSAFILPAATISQLLLLSSVAVPMLTIVFAILLANIQPRMFNMIGLKDIAVLAFLPAAIISFLFFTLLGLEAWMSLALATIIPSVINEYFTTKHRRQIEFMESALPNFLRDVTEYRKIGFHEITAIIRISKENRYNSAFDRLLRTLSRLLEQGYTPTQIMKMIKIRSWFARVTFFTLAQIAESGGGNPAVLESITGFVSSVRMTLREAKSSISIYGILGYAAPVILAFTVVVINEMLGTITPDLLKGIGSESFAQLVTVTPLFNATIKTFIVTSSIGTAIVIGKAIDRTFKSTGRIAIICGLAIASLIITENISIPGLG